MVRETTSTRVGYKAREGNQVNPALDGGKIPEGGEATFGSLIPATGTPNGNVKTMEQYP